MLDGVDGATQAALMEAIRQNREKARIAARTMTKLLSFMENSTKQVESAEQAWKDILGRLRESFLWRVR